MSALELDELRALVWSFAQSVEESQLPSTQGPGPSFPGTDLGSQSSLPQEPVLTRAKIVPEVAVWIAPSTTTVTTDVGEEPLTTCTLLAARGERESFQLLLRPQGPCGEVTITPSDLALQGPGATSFPPTTLTAGQEIKLHSLVPVNGVPDALVPLSHPASLQLLMGQTSAVWVSVSVPREASAGDYVGVSILTPLPWARS